MTDRSVASWVRRAAKPAPGVQISAPAASRATMKRRASSGAEGRPAAVGCVTTLQNSPTTGRLKPHPPDDVLARTMARRAERCSATADRCA